MATRCGAWLGGSPPRSLQRLRAHRGIIHVIVADVSETGVQFSTEFQVEPRDQFSLVTRLDGRRLRLEAEVAVQVSQGAYNRYTVGAKITSIADGDLMVIRRLAAQQGQ